MRSVFVGLERLSKPGDSRQGKTLGEGPLLERASSQKARRGLQPRRVSFFGKPALSPRQSAHGLCVLRRVMGAPARGDDSVVVASLMYKAVNKTAPSKGATRLAILVIRRPSDAGLQGRRHRGAHPEPQQRQRQMVSLSPK